MIGILAIVSILNPLMIAAQIGSTILFFIVLKLYTRPAQDLKRLEGIGICVKVFIIIPNFSIIFEN